VHVELDVVFGSSDGHPTEAATVLTITVSANASFTLNATRTVDTPNPSADNPVTEGGATRPIVQPNTEVTQFSAVSTSLLPLSRSDDLPTESEGSQTEKSRATLHRAEKAIDTIDTLKTWRRAVHVIKGVMDAVGPIASVCLISGFAYLS
jgi:hypothetical protein